jgi:nucleoside-diphosphate-sugar epimerase
VLVTGAFGNIGRNAVPALVAAGYRVRALSNRLARDRATVGSFGPAVEIVRGDVRDRAAMDAALRDVDAVVHLAYLIPPPALEKPALAAAINIGGTRTLIDAALASARRPRLLFASTLDVYGHTQHLPPPRRVGDPVKETDIYSGHKIACERMVESSGLRHCIFRFADVPPIALRTPHPMMFRIPLSTRIEAIHPADAGLAVARAIATEAAWGLTLNIGGGARCQLLYREYLGAFLDAMEIGRLPEEAFSTEPYCTDWLDTEESQRLLDYQRRTFEDIVRETAALLGFRRPLARLFRPLLRAAILQMSPFWRARGGSRGSASAM